MKIVHLSVVVDVDIKEVTYLRYSKCFKRKKKKKKKKSETKVDTNQVWFSNCFTLVMVALVKIICLYFVK